MALSLFGRSWPQPETQANPTAASTDTLLAMCTRHNLMDLVGPLKDRQATIADAEAMIADATDIRDRCAAAFASEPKQGAAMADNFIHGAFVEGKLGPAVARLMIEATAAAAGEEIDHHPPDTSGQSGINPQDFYARQNKR